MKKPVFLEFCSDNTSLLPSPVNQSSHLILVFLKILTWTCFWQAQYHLEIEEIKQVKLIEKASPFFPFPFLVGVKAPGAHKIIFEFTRKCIPSKSEISSSEPLASSSRFQNSEYCSLITSVELK